jgi:hypothetical protein
VVQRYGLWIDKKEEKINLDKDSMTSDFFALLMSICKGFVLCKLRETRQKYPYSGLIQIEEERLLDKC